MDPLIRASPLPSHMCETKGLNIPWVGLIIPHPLYKQGDWGPERLSDAQGHPAGRGKARPQHLGN